MKAYILKLNYDKIEYICKGFDYLMETVKKHQIFKDFHHISTLLIPRGDVPQLPDSLKRDLSFYYSTK